MEAYHLLLIAAVLGVVAADALVRLRVAPARRDSLVDELLSVLVAPENAASREVTKSDSVADSLLKHFQQSFASRNIIAALVEAPRGMTEEELEHRFDEMAKCSGNRSLPSSALRNVTTILMGAGFVTLTEDRYKMTELGWALHSMLGPRRRRAALAKRSFV